MSDDPEVSAVLVTKVMVKVKRNDDDVWSSRPAFYFAAVGAAVGF
jgi:hypothetical protein